MKKALILLAIVCYMSSYAQNGIEMPLYPSVDKASTGFTTEEYLQEGRAYDVAVPMLYVYLPKENATGQAVVICPGGGYHFASMPNEGHMVANWLNSQGIAAIVLKYRMPNQGHHTVPLEDAQRTIELTRENAKKWSINPAKVGIIGFSAGGHLAATATTLFTEKNRPDFSILIYPVITMTKLTHGGSRNNLLGANPSEELIKRYSAELQVTTNTPPVFIALSDDDTTVDPRNSTAFYDVLKANNIKTELHIYSGGGHGWGFTEGFKHKDEFRTSLKRWLDELNKK